MNGAKSLTLDASTGDVDLQGAVGGTTALTDLTITGADIDLSAVTLTGTLTLTPSGTIRLEGDITVDDSNVSFSRAVVLGGDVTIDTDGDDDGTDGDDYLQLDGERRSCAGAGCGRGCGDDVGCGRGHHQAGEPDDSTAARSTSTR